MPGVAGNTNAQRHGVYGYLSIGRLPKGAAYIRRQLSAFRRELERAVADQCNGDMGIRDAAFVHSACRHEARAQLLGRWLRCDECKTLGERLAVLKEIGNATDSRDKAIVALGLRRTPEHDPYADLYRTPIPAV